MGHSNCDMCGHDKDKCECKNTYVSQEGGDHYQADYQHWDWVTDCHIHYLPATCTKYVSRWRKKNGVQDLRKAMTYLDKMLAVSSVDPGHEFNPPATYKTRVYTDRIIESLGLEKQECSIFELLSGPCHPSIVMLAKEYLSDLIRTAQRAVERQPAWQPTYAAQQGKGQAQASKTSPAGRAGSTTTQPPASSASTEVAKSGSTGMEHPFGYDEAEEN